MADKVERKQGVEITSEMDNAVFKNLASVTDFCGGLERRIKDLNPSLKLIGKLKLTASESYHVRVWMGDAPKPFALMEIYPLKKGYGVVQKFEAADCGVKEALAEALGGIKPSSDGDIGGIAYVFTEFAQKLELTSFERLVAVCYAPSRQ